MLSSVVLWRRKPLLICAVVMLSTPLTVWADSWSWLPGSSQNQQSAVQAADAVRKDDSQMTVLQAGADQDEPILETANKPKAKKSSSMFSSKIWHPTKWFSSSKPKK